jgi:hypothetical protein
MQFEKVDLHNLFLTCDRACKKRIFEGGLCLRGQYLKICKVVIDRKRFRTSIRPKIIGRIFGRNEYSAGAAENEKSRP